MLKVWKVLKVLVFIWCEVQDSLVRLMVIVSEEFFSVFMYCLSSGGRVVCRVCGSIIMCYIWCWVSFRVRLVVCCLGCIEVMLVWNFLVMKVEVQRVSFQVLVRNLKDGQLSKGVLCGVFSQFISVFGSSVGMLKYQKNSCISSGVLWNSVRQVCVGQDSRCWCDSWVMVRGVLIRVVSR